MPTDRTGIRPDGLDAPTRNALAAFLRDLRSLPNESAKTHRFAGLLGELFPGGSVLPRFTQGIEKVVHIQTPTADRARRRIDAYHGNLVFEFENSLAATENVALGQLREYAAGVWGDEKPPHRPLLCIATDGVTWKVFRPALDGNAPRRPLPSQVRLEHLRTVALSNDTLREFWLWLTSALFGGHGQNPTAARFKNDFGAASVAFADALVSLQEAWETVRRVPEPQLAMENWQKYLAVTYGQFGADSRETELEALFLKHTYLATTARFLVWGALSRGKFDGTLRDEAKAVLSGEFFERHGIANLVEDDFFQWVRRREAERLLAPVWERMLAQVLTYSLDRLDEDVLKGVYQELVDPKDRHDLGEYYTPEWLCERIVEELLPSAGWVSVLDPTCGSGSFLLASIAHLLKRNPNGGGQLRKVLDHVVGIDIHPLAVIIARATYVLAINPLIRSAKRPIQIPVYLADSLFLPSEVKQLTLGETPGFEIRFGGDRKVSIPEELVKDAELFDPAIAAAAKVAADHANSGKETATTLRTYLSRSIPSLAERADYDGIIAALWRLTSELADLIKKQRNSIWAFIIRNAYRPAMFRGRFDFIVGNPPWLSYRFISDTDYQEEVKRRAVTEYEVAPKSQKLMTQMELATIFLVHTLSTFGRTGARLGFVMPRSVLSGDQHERLRLRTYRAPFVLDSYWDLLEVQPLFGVPACVLFASKSVERAQDNSTYSVPAVEWAGRLPARDLTWAEASPALTRSEKKARLIYLGSRSALSTSLGNPKPNRPSPYMKLFHQGATIVPRSCYFVSVEGADGGVPEQDRVYAVQTDPVQAKVAKEPYKDVRMHGRIEGAFLFHTAVSKHVVPFRLTGSVLVVLPGVLKDGRLILLPPDDLRKEGFREVARWMDEVQRIWAKKRGGKASLQDAYQALDYNGKLTAQHLGTRHLVVYNHSGTNVAAARVDRGSFQSRFVVDVKLYGAECRSKEEALYLTAVLNSETVNLAIKPFQSVGLQGERDIHKKLLELPIPGFVRTNQVHAKLVVLASRAEEEAAGSLGYSRSPDGAESYTSSPTSLAKRRGHVRDSLKNTLREIDDEVGHLLESSTDA